ncbi:MAG: dockerin type I domain-containing protein, partial [Planctomycetota bacterium]|nr:dockerin type I domain-containing protein [Planctomycetota bacterium]
TVMVVNGASIPPAQNSGAVDVVGVPDPEFSYHAEDASGNYNPDDGNASVSVSIDISETDNSGLGAPFPNETQGFSMGLANGSEVFATAVNLSLPFTPDFAEDNLFTNGWTIGVVYAFTGGVTLPFTQQTTVITADYDTGGSMAGDPDGATVALTWDDGLGSPPVANVVVVDGGSSQALFDDGSITLNAVVTTDFIRGDVNADEKVNIADGIWIIYELFLGGPVSTCPISRDVNGDGNVDTGDAVYLFNYRFLDGPDPAAPFPGCGQETDQTPEDCATSFCG